MRHVRTPHYHVLCILPGNNEITRVVSERSEADCIALEFNGTVRECHNPFHLPASLDALARATGQRNTTMIAQRAADILRRNETRDRHEAIRRAVDEIADAYSDAEDGND